MLLPLLLSLELPLADLLSTAFVHPKIQGNRTTSCARKLVVHALAHVRTKQSEIYLGKFATVSFRVAKSKSTGKGSLGAKTGSLLNRRVGRESGKRIFSKAERKRFGCPYGNTGS